MRHFAMLIIALVVGLALSAPALGRAYRHPNKPVTSALPRYKKLVWSDEFNGPAGTPPVAAKWTHDVGAWGFTNQELETYTDSPANASDDGHGHLAIVARRQTATGPDGLTRNYTSARLETQGLFSANHGLIEARMRIPAGRGLWPAFWMLGDNVNKVSWPACGEVDVLEALGQQPSIAHGFINGPFGTSHYTVDRAISSRRSLASAFHTFAISWSRNSITWLLDGVRYGTVTPKDLPPGAKWVYNRSFHLILNLAVGGDWGGPPSAATRFPASLLVDWVRVYQ